MPVGRTTARAQLVEGRSRGEQKSKATLILVLGILSFFICGLILGYYAYSEGKKELRAIDAGELPESGRTMAQAGMFCGIIACIAWAIALVFQLATGALVALMVR